MNIQLLKCLFFLILLNIFQPVLAQSISASDAQQLLNKDILSQKLIPNSNENLISKNQNVANLTHSTQLDLNTSKIS